ncbi:hypothetical protein [Pedobacter punctiformis]|uniref:Lipoprotein n=1 Tax=Pedobacter punctiformis TaxID=3004097 RepID=A0ABT4LC62_9SPHI|nr:hypothetical protein [Pedobacter sp. HCMS5-2]MCZ4244379.1 hypothetical protein [Pedobacter sp. HCMS5-2]
MKKYHYILILLITGTFLAACKKDNMVYQSDYTKSYQAWLNFKASTSNAYRYQANTASWTGYSSQTIITVQNGEVVKRSYVAKNIDQKTHAVIVLKEWIEDKASLNTHQEGAATKTLDEVYLMAKNEWLLKRKDAETYFEAKNNGMISSCGYVENGCQDDCFTGISIGFIEKL